MTFAKWVRSRREVKNEREEQVDGAFPRFNSKLNSLCSMSDTEHKVCMLIKLRVTPLDIAALLHKDVNPISSVRSRLYVKVFNQKGGAKDWDEFLRTL